MMVARGQRLLGLTVTALARWSASATDTKRLDGVQKPDQNAVLALMRHEL